MLGFSALAECGLADDSPFQNTIPIVYLFSNQSINVTAGFGHKFFESISGRPVESDGPEGGPELPSFPD